MVGQLLLGERGRHAHVPKRHRGRGKGFHHDLFDPQPPMVGNPTINRIHKDVLLVPLNITCQNISISMHLFCTLFISSNYYKIHLRCLD
jgi:hypothetical protein